MRKLLPLLILSILIISCTDSQKTLGVHAEQTNDINPDESTDQQKNTISFNNKRGQAVLLGESIKLFDENQNEIEDISNLSTSIVEITGISDSLFNDTEDFCKSYWYVKIKSGNKVGLVKGRHVFKLEDIGRDQDTTISVNGSTIKFLTTQCLCMGVEYQGDLVDCPVDQPIIIKDEKNKFTGLVHVIPNKYHEEAIWNNSFKFFQLRSDGGFFDKINVITPQESGIKISIHRIFQEGENDYDVLLRFDQGRYTSEYLNYGEIKYE